MCFTMAGLGMLLIWLIIIGAVIALVRLFLPFALGWLGTAGGVIRSAIDIVMWAIIAIVVVTFVFQLISCLFSMGGGIPHFGVR